MPPFLCLLWCAVSVNYDAPLQFSFLCSYLTFLRRASCLALSYPWSRLLLTPKHRPCLCFRMRRFLLCSGIFSFQAPCVFYEPSRSTLSGVSALCTGSPTLDKALCFWKYAFAALSEMPLLRLPDLLIPSHCFGHKFWLSSRRALLLWAHMSWHRSNVNYKDILCLLVLLKMQLSLSL